MLLILILAVAGCYSVQGATPQGIWLKRPFIPLGDPDAIAAEHCARYGKRAELAGQLGSGAPSDPYLPIIAYNCR
jgi:hypothetical protein